MNNWLEAYGLLRLYIYIHEQFFSLFDANTNVLTGFIISPLQHLQEYEEHET